jgi:hypothetical protein
LTEPGSAPIGHSKRRRGRAVAGEFSVSGGYSTADGFPRVSVRSATCWARASTPGSPNTDRRAGASRRGGRSGPIPRLPP